MPNYTIENRKTGKQSDVTMSISDFDQYLIDHPEVFQVITSARGFIPGVKTKPDNVFNDMLKEMKKSHPGSTINTY